MSIERDCKCSSQIHSVNSLLRSPLRYLHARLDNDVHKTLLFDIELNRIDERHLFCELKRKDMREKQNQFRNKNILIFVCH